MASKPILINVPELRIYKNSWGEHVVQEHRQETLRKRWIAVSSEYPNITSAKAKMATLILDYMKESESDGVDR